MDETKADPEASALAIELASVAEKQFATFLDEIAGMIDEQEMTYHESSFALRTAAGILRTRYATSGGEK